MLEMKSKGCITFWPKFENSLAVIAAFDQVGLLYQVIRVAQSNKVMYWAIFATFGRFYTQSSWSHRSAQYQKLISNLGNVTQKLHLPVAISVIRFGDYLPLWLLWTF